jgi:hypothetical protein
MPPQKRSGPWKGWSVYDLKDLLLRFLSKQAVEPRQPVLTTSAATLSRAGVTLSVAHRVRDRFGTLWRCPWSWESGRGHEVMRGQDVLGMVLTIHPSALPLPGLLCSKQGRDKTTKADVLIALLSRVKTAWPRQGVAITKMPLTMDAWFVSQPLRQRLHDLGLTHIILAGTRHDPCPIARHKQDASQWKTALVLHEPTWGIDGPSGRVHAKSPTFGSRLLFFFQKSTTRSAYLMHLRHVSMRGAEIWHMWKQHHLMECFWKILTSIFPIRGKP